MRIVALLGVILLAVVLLGKKIPPGFIPEEDQGYVLINIALPPASSLQRTDEISKKVDSFLKEEESIFLYYNQRI
jgi:HAE1 family hydrophobic/amphiphilic exporter-1